MPESNPGPHPQTWDLVLSPPLLLLWSVHIELDQCYHPDHLSERGRETHSVWYLITLSQCMVSNLLAVMLIF